jgi:hypothetical protein
MSSATKWGVDQVRTDLASGKIPSPIQSKEVDGPTNHMSPRQNGLDRLWRFYRCSNYVGRKFDWNGHENMGHVEHDIVAHTGFIPPGFTDAGGAMIPLKFRAPSTPYFLSKVIVNRFTSLLFSAKRHPKIACDDPLTEDWLQGFAEATRLWANMIRARTYGGAMGAVGLGFKFIDGQPFVEVHDPRWCTPTFTDRDLLTVGRFEKLYQYTQPGKNEKGEWEDKWYWYRRLIDKRRDIVWSKIEVKSNETPNWRREKFHAVEHGYGFCPIVWVQNQQVDDDIDGDADCHGVFELIERIDCLLSQADRGTIANCDPTLQIASDSDFEMIKKGSGNALHFEKGGMASYLEMNGAGIDKALTLADKLEQKALTVARCMLDRNEGGPSRTVSEVEHNYSSMIEQADIFREQYGEKGVKSLLDMVLKVVRQMSSPRIDSTGAMPKIVRTVIKMPKKKVLDEETGKIVGWEERQIGKGAQIELVWPQYFTPSAEEVGKAVEAAGKAKQYMIVDTDHAVGYVAEFFNVENKAAMLKSIKAEAPAAPGGGVAESVAGRTEVSGESEEGYGG